MVGLVGCGDGGGRGRGEGGWGMGMNARTLPIASIALSKNMTTPPVKNTPPAACVRTSSGGWFGEAKLPRSYLPPVQKAAPTSGDSHAVSRAWGPGRGKREGGIGRRRTLRVGEPEGGHGGGGGGGGGFARGRREWEGRGGRGGG